MSIQDVPQSLASHVLTRTQLDALRSGQGVAMSDLSPEQRQALADLSATERSAVEGLLRSAATDAGNGESAVPQVQGDANAMAPGRYQSAELGPAPLQFADVAPASGAADSPVPPTGAAPAAGSRADVDRRIREMTAGRDLQPRLAVSAVDAQALTRATRMRVRTINLQTTGPKGVGTSQTSHMDHYDPHRMGAVLRGNLTTLGFLNQGDTPLAQEYRALVARLDAVDFKQMDRQAAAQLFVDLRDFCAGIATAELSPAQQQALEHAFQAHEPRDGSLERLLSDAGFQTVQEAQARYGLPATGITDAQTYAALRACVLDRSACIANANEGLAFTYVERQAQEVRKAADPLIAQHQELVRLRSRLTGPDGSARLDGTALAALGISRNDQGQFVQEGRILGTDELRLVLDAQITAQYQAIEEHMGQAHALIAAHSNELLPTQVATATDILDWSDQITGGRLPQDGTGATGQVMTTRLGRRAVGMGMRGIVSGVGSVGRQISQIPGDTPAGTGSTGQVDVLPFTRQQMQDLRTGRMSIHDMTDDQRAFIAEMDPRFVRIDEQGRVTIVGLDDAGIDRLFAAEAMMENPPNDVIAEMLGHVAQAINAWEELQILEDAALEAAALAEEVTAHLEALIADLQAANGSQMLVFPDLQPPTDSPEGADVVAAGGLARGRAAEQERQRAVGAQWLELISRPGSAPSQMTELVEQRASDLQQEDRQMRQAYQAAVARDHAERQGRPVLTTTVPAP